MLIVANVANVLLKATTINVLKTPHMIAASASFAERILRISLSVSRYGHLYNKSS